MSVLFIGKRFYTHRDAVRERYGRIYQLPLHWSRAGIASRLWLIDYHSHESIRDRDGSLEIVSTPALGIQGVRQLLAEAFPATRLGPAVPTHVVASGDCYVGLLAYRLALRFRARFVFDIYDRYDVFPTYRRLPGFDPFQFLLRRADVRLFASRALMEHVIANRGSSIHVPNGVDLERFRPLDMAESRLALGLPRERQLVGYFGSLTSDRGIDDLIEAVRMLRAKGLPLQLVLGGKLSAEISLEGASHMIYLGNLPFENVPLALASCDVLAIPYRNSQFLDMASSVKIAEIIAARRPFVATRTPNFVANFPLQAQQLEAGLANPGDPASLAEAIRTQLETPVLVDLPSGLDWASIAAEAANGAALQPEDRQSA